MPKITKILPLHANSQYPEPKVLVYIDGQKCTSIRERTWRTMNLKVGDSISCDELKRRENLHWKNQYGEKDRDGKNAWEREKIRLSKVCSLIENIDPRIEVKIVGFGADSNEMIPEHPKESGKPDMEILLRDTKEVLILVEVTGTEAMRGHSYWVRQDKLMYLQSHPDQDIWMILHYAKPSEKYVFIKPFFGKTYTPVPKVIKGSTELYVEFQDKDGEVTDFAKFRDHIIELVESCTLSQHKPLSR